MTRALVTGAAGAVGPVLMARLACNSDWTVQGTDRRVSSHQQILPCDLCDRRHVEELVREIRPDLIFHLAGATAGTLDELYAANVQAARVLLETVAACCPKARVVLTGSAAEYGAVAPEDNPIAESRPLTPVSPYGLTKAWQTLLMPYFVQRGVAVVVARPFNLDGPGLSERLFVGRIQRQIEDLRLGRRSKIEVGPLSAVRDYVGFEEAARQFEAIARKGIPGHVYHVASGKPVTMRQFLHGYLTRYGLDFSCVDERPENTNRSGFDVPAIYADTANIQRLLAESPSLAE